MEKFTRLTTSQRIFFLVIILAVLAFVTFTHVPFSAYAAMLPDGSSARIGSTIDVFVFNDYSYSRLIINPIVFAMYGHLNFYNVMSVSRAEMNSHPRTDIVRHCEAGDPRVFALETVGSDTMIAHWINLTPAQVLAVDSNFYRKVFCMNELEANYYQIGTPYSTVAQLEAFLRVGPTPTPVSTISPPTQGDLVVSIEPKITPYVRARDIYKDFYAQIAFTCDVITTRQSLTSGQSMMFDNRNGFPIDITYGGKPISINAYDYVIASIDLIGQRPTVANIACEGSNRVQITIYP